MVAPIFLTFVHITNISFNSNSLNVLFWVIISIIKVTNVLILMAKLLFIEMSFSVSLHFILLIKFNHPYLILFHPFFYPFAVFLMISSFGSFTHLEIVQSVTNVSTPTVSPLTTNTYDSVVSHRAFSPNTRRFSFCSNATLQKYSFYVHSI